MLHQKKEPNEKFLKCVQISVPMLWVSDFRIYNFCLKVARENAFSHSTYQQDVFES
jgi:hypothetical protein